MSVDSSKIPTSRLKKETFDAEPKSGSSNIVSSGAVFTALSNKLDKEATADKATADANGNVITETYAKISDVIFYEETK